MDNFKIAFLDHVAIRVRDLQISADWYEKVLGLRKYQKLEWGIFPILMLSNKSGVALFPANVEDPKLDVNSKNVKIDHFAFNVTNKNFDKALNKYKSLNLDHYEQDHFYFKSVYTKDPDGNIVELTTIVVDEKVFY